MAVLDPNQRPIPTRIRNKFLSGCTAAAMTIVDPVCPVSPDITFGKIWDREIVDWDSMFSPSLTLWFHVDFTLIPCALNPHQGKV
jgi:hypothetical protein